MRRGLRTIAVVLAGLCAGCPNQDRNRSIEKANEGAKALSAGQFDTAISHYEEAVKIYGDNHNALYGLATALVKRNRWKEAAEAYGKAVERKSDDPMYHMWCGIASYESTLQQAREDQARREDKKPEEVVVEVKGLNFEPAIQHLQTAIKANPDLWRAHYNLGRIYRDQDKAQEAAEAFTRAIQANPREDKPYVALGELYRRWDFLDQAIAVTSQGVVNVPGSTERSEIFFSLGMSYYQNNAVDKAIDAFSQAIENRKDIHKARFQRGKAYFEKGELDKAKKDLEQYAKSAGSAEDFNKNIANKLLLDIASKQI